MSSILGSSLLITGGTGSFGKAFIAEILTKFPDLKRLVVYSRDELKQWELQQLYPPDVYPQLRFFLEMISMLMLINNTFMSLVLSTIYDNIIIKS